MNSSELAVKPPAYSPQQANEDAESDKRTIRNMIILVVVGAVLTFGIARLAINIAEGANAPEGTPAVEVPAGELQVPSATIQHGDHTHQVVDIRELFKQHREEAGAE